MYSRTPTPIPAQPQPQRPVLSAPKKEPRDLTLSMAPGVPSGFGVL